MFEIQTTNVASFKNDILCGLTVALALVREAVAFAFIAGVEPLVGLYSAGIARGRRGARFQPFASADLSGAAQLFAASSSSAAFSNRY